MAEQLYELLSVFLRQLHPEYLANPLYIFGESYGGKYCPSIAAYIHEVESSMSPAQRLNLQGIGIGNGLTDTPNQSLTFASFLFNHGRPACHAIASAVRDTEHLLISATHRCHHHCTEGQLIGYAGAVPTAVPCAVVLECLGCLLVDGVLCQPSRTPSRSYTHTRAVDWRQPCLAESCNVAQGVNMYNVDCFIQCGKERFAWSDLIPFMNRTDVKQQLHVPATTVFENPSPAVSQAMNSDVCKSVAGVMPTLLSNYRVLLYEGMLDYVVNAPGLEIWLSKVAWSGMPGFQNTKRRRWFSKPNGALDITGFVQQYSNLTQLMLPNTGHFATIDQPAVAAAMVHNWLYNIPFAVERPSLDDSELTVE